MPIKIKIPELDQYELTQGWIKEIEEHFLSVLNDPHQRWKPTQDSFKLTVLEYISINYPISNRDLKDAEVFLTYDEMRAQF